ncbi:MAG TPA: hypothetical protein PK668_26365 [Myxococcota bacterium]|nr:hypothetical protein [Myxococcota bacterium]HRY97052.1 hypothetical protein [Myxococcota bacterium]HSA22426.1 hypothetical protein [Myxococcota bacterium]
MSRNIRCWSACLGALVLVGLTGLAAPARAQVIYHSGQDAFDVADITDDIIDSMAAELQVPEEGKAEFKALFAGQKVGYQCEIFGLFWAYFAWWSCEPIMLKWVDDSTFEFLPLEPAKVADPNQRELSQALVNAFEKKAGGKKFVEAYPISDARMGFWTRHGRWVMALIIVALVVFAVLRKRAASQAAAFPTASHGSGPKAPDA